MPINYSNYANTSATYDKVINTCMSSNNKNDAIKSLKNMTIQNTNVQIGEKYAHSIYNSYSKYHGGSGRYR